MWGKRNPRMIWLIWKWSRTLWPLKSQSRDRESKQSNKKGSAEEVRQEAGGWGTGWGSGRQIKRIVIEEQVEMGQHIYCRDYEGSENRWANGWGSQVMGNGRNKGYCSSWGSGRVWEAEESWCADKWTGRERKVAKISLILFCFQSIVSDFVGQQNSHWWFALIRGAVL